MVNQFCLFSVVGYHGRQWTPSGQNPHVSNSAPCEASVFNWMAARSSSLYLLILIQDTLTPLLRTYPMFSIDCLQNVAVDCSLFKAAVIFDFKARFQLLIFIFISQCRRFSLKIGQHTSKKCNIGIIIV